MTLTPRDRLIATVTFDRCVDVLRAGFPDEAAELERCSEYIVDIPEWVDDVLSADNVD
jgi:hypothetical protein